jgi:uncharacterized protein (DUF433 family)
VKNARRSRLEWRFKSAITRAGGILPPLQALITRHYSPHFPFSRRRLFFLFSPASDLRPSTTERSPSLKHAALWSILHPMQDYRQRITIEPGKRGGKPCIRHMRITVYDILGWLAAGMSNADILTDFPELTAEDIQATLAFAADREHHLVAASA